MRLRTSVMFLFTISNWSFLSFSVYTFVDIRLKVLILYSLLSKPIKIHVEHMLNFVHVDLYKDTFSVLFQFTL